MVISLEMCAPSHASCISLLPPDWTSTFLVWFLLRRPIMTKVEPRLMLVWFGHHCIQTLSSTQFNLWSSKHLADKMNDYIYVWCLTWMVMYWMQWWCATSKDANVQREVVVLTRSLDPTPLLMEDCTSNCELEKYVFMFYLMHTMKWWNHFSQVYWPNIKLLLAIR